MPNAAKRGGLGMLRPVVRSLHHGRDANPAAAAGVIDDGRRPR